MRRQESAGATSSAAAPQVIHSKAEFDTQINKDALTIVDFTASWCGPCKRIAPHFAELARSYSGSAQAFKVDVDENQAAMQSARVKSMPTFIAYKAGREVGRVSGADPNALAHLFAKNVAEVTAAAARVGQQQSPTTNVVHPSSASTPPSPQASPKKKADAEPGSYCPSENAFASLLADNDIVIVDYTASWCGPCKRIGPVFVSLAHKYNRTGLVCRKVDVDNLPNAAKIGGVRAMPTFSVFHKGKKVQQIQGADPRALEQLVASQASIAASRAATTPPPSPTAAAVAAARAQQQQQQQKQQVVSPCQFEIRMYSAEWCKPCKKIAPAFAELRAKLATDATNIKLTTVKVADPDARPTHVEVLPSFVVYRDGKKVEQISGAHEDKLRTLCREYVRLALVEESLSREPAISQRVESVLRKAGLQ